MTGTAMSGLHDDAALAEVDSRVLAAGGDRELRALAHLDDGAVEEANEGVGAVGSADQFTVGKLRADLDQLVAGGRHAIDRALGGLDLAAHAGRRLQVPRRQQGTGDEDDERGGGKSELRYA